MEEINYSVSCAHLNWIFDLCQNRKFQLEKITRESAFSLEHLKDESRFISWQAFADIVSGVGNFFDEVDLRETGRKSWNFSPLQSHGSIGRIMFSANDQYLATFGMAGFCVRHFPLNTRVEQQSAGRLIVRISMKDGACACYPFYTILAGQMEGLTAALGLPYASVTLEPDDRGVCYTVEYPVPSILTSLTRRIGTWLTSSRTVTREFAIVQESYERLLIQHQETLLAKNSAEAQLAQWQHIGGSDVIWKFTRNFHITDASPSVSKVLGYAEAEFRSLPLQQWMSENHVDAVKRLIDGLFKDGDIEAVGNLDIQLQHKDGHLLWFELKAVLEESTELELPVNGNQGTVVCTGTDITERREIEDELNERVTSYQVITDSALDAIITFDADNRIIYANPAASDVFGYEHAALVSMDIKDLMPESLGGARLRDIYRPDGLISTSGLALQGLRRDKSLVSLETSFASHELNGLNYKTCVIRDITGRTILEKERQALETQLQAAQKIDSVGQLAGGIAHDFNNLLVAILGYADLALQSSSQETIVRYLEEIRKAGERGTDMTQKLLTFSRQKVIEPKIIDANKLIEGVREMIFRLLPRNIEVIFNSQVDDVHLLAEQTQLEQVLINLAVNARDAMPNGGILKVSLSSGALKPDNKPYLVVKVTDTGTGMDPEIEKRIFEPFYTTKPEGSGTGLGLSVVLGIVNQHHGHIKVESELGKGSQFVIYLPISDSQSKQQESRIQSGNLTGTETVLVVEDNEQVRELAKLMLIGAGYKVIEAVDGQEGVEKFIENAAEIDIVLMDVVMPRMSGHEAAIRIQEIKPDAKIVFTTGYSNNSIHTQFIEDQGLPLIAKPYGTESLRYQVRSFLDNGPEKIAGADANRPGTTAAG